MGNNFKSQKKKKNYKYGNQKEHMERKGKGNFRIRKVLLGRFSEQRTAHVGEGSQSFTQRGTMGHPVQLLCRQDTEREETQLGLPKWWVASWNQS